MQKKAETLRHGCALLVLLALLLQLLPLPVLAADDPAEEPLVQTEEVPVEPEVPTTQLLAATLGNALQPEQNYVITLVYQYPDSAHTNAAESDTRFFYRTDPMEFTLPTSAKYPNLKAMTPEVRAYDQVQPDVIQALNGYLSQGGEPYTFSVPVRDWDRFITLCYQAGFMEQDENGNYVTDDLGAIRIRIPLVYRFLGTLPFRVEYCFQPLNAAETGVVEDFSQYVTLPEYPAGIGEVQGTNQVLLTEEFPELVLSAPAGYHLSEESQRLVEKAQSIEKDTVIRLYYVRNTYSLYVNTSGGKAVSPMDVPWGANVNQLLFDLHDRLSRTGYTHSHKWKVAREDGTVTDVLDVSNAQTPVIRMEGDNLPVEAHVQWDQGENVELVFWLDAEPDLPPEAPVQWYLIHDKTLRVSIPAGTPIDEQMFEQYKKSLTLELFPEIKYYHFNMESTKAHNPAGETISGSGITKVNLCYDRNAYTVNFHLGKDHRSWLSNFQLAHDGVSNNEDNWQSGYQWVGTPTDASMQADGREYRLSQTEPSSFYSITAKYGAEIGDRWPTNVGLTQSGAPYFLYWQRQKGSGTGSVWNADTAKLYGLVTDMSSDLIMHDASGIPTGKANNLVAIWYSVDGTRTEKYVFESTPEKGVPLSAFPLGQGTVHEKYSQRPADGTYWYEDKAREMVYHMGPWEHSMTATMIPPTFPGTVCNYAVYQTNGYGGGTTVYYFYTYDKYHLTYDYTLPGSPNEQTEVGTFNINDRMPRRADGTPLNTFVPPDVKGYTFAGWYKNPKLTTPVTQEDYQTVPLKNLRVYAKWIREPVTIRLLVPGGEIPTLPESINGCPIKSMPLQGAEGGTEYQITQVTQGTLQNAFGRDLDVYAQIVQPRGRHNPKNGEGLAFDCWEKLDGTRYLYHPESLLDDNHVLIARWKVNRGAVYAVHYLTDTDPGNGLPTYQVTETGPDGQPQIRSYFRLKEDLVRRGQNVGPFDLRRYGKDLRAPAVEGYIPLCRELKARDIQANPENNHFCFFYEPCDMPLRYEVHYVLAVPDGAGGYIDECFSNSPPPVGDPRYVPCWPSKVVQLPAGSSAFWVEEAEAIPGYTLRGAHTRNIILSKDTTENHLYFYYTQNVPTVPYTIAVYVQQDGTYSQSPSASFSASGPNLSMVRAADVVSGAGVGFVAEADMAAFRTLLDGQTLDLEYYASTGAHPAVRIQKDPPVQLNVYLREKKRPMTLQLVKMDPWGTPLDGADFRLEGESGTVQGSTGGQSAGTLTFEELLPGTYHLTEVKAPQGYQGGVDLTLTYDPHAVPSLTVMGDQTGVSITGQENSWIITIQNTPQYNVTISSRELTAVYEAPSMIWDPVSMAYVAKPGTHGGWKVAPEQVTVTNASPVEVPLTVTAGLQLQSPTGADWDAWLGQVTLECAAGGQSQSMTYDPTVGGPRTLSTTLSRSESAVLRLHLPTPTKEVAQTLQTAQPVPLGQLTIAWSLPRHKHGGP